MTETGRRKADWALNGLIPDAGPPI